MQPLHRASSDEISYFVRNRHVTQSDLRHLDREIGGKAALSLYRLRREERKLKSVDNIRRFYSGKTQCYEWRCLRYILICIYVTCELCNRFCLEHLSYKWPCRCLVGFLLFFENYKFHFDKFSAITYNSISKAYDNK